MITFIYGPNSYEIQQKISSIVKVYPVDAIDRRDGAEIDVNELPELLHGMSLFATERVVVIKNLASNKQVWEYLARQIEAIPSETHLVLVETNPDKRTKTFKALQKVAEVVICEDLNEAQAITWLTNEAKRQHSTIEKAAARELVERVGTDQWQLAHELEKLLLVGDTSVEKITQTVETTPQANVFALLDAAFAGSQEKVKELLAICATKEDPYKFFGLLAGQIFQLAVVANAEGRAVEQIAKDISAHPYPLKKLQSLAHRANKQNILYVAKVVAKLDDQIKSSAGEPWLLIESALMKIAKR